MSRSAFGRLAGLMLVLYGILGLFVCVAVVVVGYSTFGQVATFARQLESQRLAVVSSLRTAAGTVHDTQTGMAGFQQTVDGAQQASDQASQLAFNTSISFRQMSDQLNIQIFGIQPFAQVVPQFQQSADQLVQLAITLGDTRDGLKQSSGDVQRVSTDLGQLQTQLGNMATTLDQATAFSNLDQQLRLFELAFYGMCVLVALQSFFSILGGFALMRLAQTPTQQVTIIETVNPAAERLRQSA